MTAFVHWLLARRYVLLVLAIAVAPMVPMLAAALLTLETIHRGPYQGLVSAAIAATGVLLIGAIVDTNVVFNMVGVATMVSGAALGALVGLTQSRFRRVCCFASLASCWPSCSGRMRTA